MKKCFPENVNIHYCGAGLVIEVTLSSWNTENAGWFCGNLIQNHNNDHLER